MNYSITEIRNGTGFPRGARFVNAEDFDILKTALINLLPYAENEVAAICELADDGDEEAQREVAEATAALSAARTYAP